MVVKLILDTTQFPGADPDDGDNPSVKIIRASSDYTTIAIDASVTLSTGFANFNSIVTIYGLLRDDVFAFTKINQQNVINLYKNEIQIYAGYTLDSNGMPPFVYAGQVFQALPNFNDTNRALTIVSQAGLVNQNTIAQNTNIKGDIALDSLFRQICSLQGGLIYQPFNVTGFGNNHSYKGSAMDQLKQATSDYGYQVKFNNNGNGAIAMVSPIGNPFSSQLTQINLNTGMIGYPISSDLGLDVKVYFDPTLTFGQQVQLSSVLPLSDFNNIYFINGMQHTLQTKGTEWNSALKLNISPFQQGQDIPRNG